MTSSDGNSAPDNGESDDIADPDSNGGPDSNADPDSNGGPDSNADPDSNGGPDSNADPDNNGGPDIADIAIEECVAVVTGGAGGIGRGIVGALLRRGAAVVVADIEQAAI